MLELGKSSTKMHIEVLEILKKVKPEIVYTMENIQVIFKGPTKQ